MRRSHCDLHSALFIFDLTTWTVALGGGSVFILQMKTPRLSVKPLEGFPWKVPCEAR